MPAEMSRNARILAAIGVALAMFLAALDQTIVGTALPRIVAELQGLEFYAWVATAYMVASTTTTPISGKLGDLFGRKPVLLVGIAGFVLASALCGQAQDMTELVLFRGVQGLFGGVLFASVFASVADLFDPRTRARVQGMFGGIFGIASIVGPVVGGALTDNVGWRWVFYVNVPVGLVALAVVFLTMPAVAHKASWRDIDFAGAAALTATLVPMLIGFSITRDHDFTSPEVLGLLGFAAVMAVIFFVIEQRAEHPIVPFVLWKNATFAVSMITGFFVAFGMFGAILYVPLLYQGVLGIAATNSGLLVTPMMLGMITASLTTGQIITRVDRYRLVGTVGILVMVSGLYLLGQVTVGTPEIEVVRDLVLVGAGLGVTFPLYINAAQGAVARQYLGVVSSQIQFWRNVGGTIGVSVLGAILSHELPGKIQTAIASLDLPPQALSQIPSGGSPQAIFDTARIAATRVQLPPQLQPVFDQILAAVRGALAATIHDVFFYATAITLVAVIASLFLREVPIRAQTPAERRQVAEAETREGAPTFGG
ncbi:MAG TPA: DHA2 family efflux MFS transporter permease subunit [Candidatus Limnocylindria bacterium]|nr:DHA2 family efflux MFS transporter permease subunit [Candidatus Limnocylindria bacterium]